MGVFLFKAFLGFALIIGVASTLSFLKGTFLQMKKQWQERLRREQ